MTEKKIYKFGYQCISKCFGIDARSIFLLRRRVGRLKALGAMGAMGAMGTLGALGRLGKLGTMEIRRWPPS